MFGKKGKRQWMLSLRDSAGARLFDDALHRLRVPEACILAMSLEFFDDPEPCEIHRSAVIMRGLEEIRMACAGRESLHITELPRRLQDLLGEYPDARVLSLYQRELS